MSDDSFEKLLEHVKVIRESVEPKPDPPAPPAPEGFIEEFQAFLSKYGVIGLAIAVIIGGAAGKLVSSLVGDILMPIITFFIPAIFTIGENRNTITVIRGREISPFLSVYFITVWFLIWSVNDANSYIKGSGVIRAGKRKSDFQ